MGPCNSRPSNILGDASRLACALAFCSYAAGALAQTTMPGAVDCRMLATMPNAPMTVEACEAQMAGYRRLQEASAQGGGERPGDDALTCAQIADEMKTMQVAGVSKENAAAAIAAGQDLKSSLDRTQAETAGRMAPQTAATAAAAMSGNNAVQGAVAQAQLQENMAFAGKAQSELGPARSRAAMANAAALGDLTASMRANPRFGRLIMLAGNKNCQY